MRPNAISCATALIIALTVRFDLTRIIAGQPQSAEHGAWPTNANVSVFFGTSDALSIDDIRERAWTALRDRGHNIPRSLYCALNVQVIGREPGCVVMFQDL